MTTLRWSKSVINARRGARQMRLGVIGREASRHYPEASGHEESFSISSVRAGEQGDEYYVTYPSGSTRRRLLKMHVRRVLPDATPPL